MNHNLTNIIDSRQLIAQLDKSNALGSIEALADQINQTWQETRKIIFIPTKKIENVVVAGMGGSGLGAHVIQYLFKDELNVPFSIANSSSLPNYVNESTLVILSSYSGNTEETLKCAQHAKDKNAQIMVITAGGELQKIAKQENYPLYLIDPKFNPSQQPRMAIGNSVFGQIALLEKAGIISLTDEQVSEVINNVIYD